MKVRPRADEALEERSLANLRPIALDEYEVFATVAVAGLTRLAAPFQELLEGAVVSTRHLAAMVQKLSLELLEGGSFVWSQAGMATDRAVGKHLRTDDAAGIVKPLQRATRFSLDIAEEFGAAMCVENSRGLMVPVCILFLGPTAVVAPMAPLLSMSAISMPLQYVYFGVGILLLQRAFSLAREDAGSELVEDHTAPIRVKSAIVMVCVSGAYLTVAFLGGAPQSLVERFVQPEIALHYILSCFTTPIMLTSFGEVTLASSNGACFAGFICAISSCLCLGACAVPVGAVSITMLGAGLAFIAIPSTVIQVLSRSAYTAGWSSFNNIGDILIFSWLGYPAVHLLGQVTPLATFPQFTLSVLAMIDIIYYAGFHGFMNHKNMTPMIVSASRIRMEMPRVPTVAGRWSEEAIQDGVRPDKDNQCMVCLQDFETDSFVQLLPCYHVFHQECIEQWISSRHMLRELRCPLCRSDLPVPERLGRFGIGWARVLAQPTLFERFQGIVRSLENDLR